MVSIESISKGWQVFPKIVGLIGAIDEFKESGYNGFIPTRL
ncbi:MAG: hypothetical protein NZ959_11945 [Armatimonadetes bacterium]|nr:hypothetical protein [Armatimonadota bacterium]MDW8123000.1 hypothetical protein [Armatimonadota bacterium]